MINIHTQTPIDKNRIIALYDPKRVIYGTDGVLFACNEEGDIFRAIAPKAEITISTPISDINKWLKVDLVNNQSSFNQDLGALRKGLDFVLSANMKLSLTAGRIQIFNEQEIKYTSYGFAPVTNATLDVIDSSGAVIESGLTSIDVQSWNDGGVKTALSRDKHATFIKIYHGIDSKLYMMRGEVVYKTLGDASYNYMKEDIPQLENKELIFIGGFIASKGCTTLNSNKARIIYTSKFGDHRVGNSGSYYSLLKTPVESEIALKDVESPVDGETRQILETLPDVTFFVFNPSATEGLSPNDGTLGKWSKIESTGKLKVSEQTDDFTSEVNYQYLVDCSAKNIDVFVPNVNTSTKEKVFNVTKIDNSNNIVKILYGGRIVYSLREQEQSVNIIYTETTARVETDYQPYNYNIDYSSIGRFVFQLPDADKGIYPLDGQTVIDKLLAQHIDNNSSQYIGFSTNGNSVTLPDWRGDILYGGGNRGLDDKQGTAVSQDLQHHHHNFRVSRDDYTGGGGYPVEGDHSGGIHNTSDFGGAYTRVFGRTSRICIVGTSFIKLSVDSTLATPINVSFTGCTVEGGKSNMSIYEGVHAFSVTVDLPTNKILDTVTNAKILDAKEGRISFNQAIGAGDITIDITTKDAPIKYKHQIFTNNVNVNTSEKTIKTWDVFPKNSGDVIELSYRMPTRNDDGGWGGTYMYIYYSVDNGSNWTRIYDSGYDSAMTNGGDSITSHTGVFIVDINEVTNATSVKFKYGCRTYNGDGSVNGSHGIGSHTGGNGYTTLGLKVIN